MVDSLQQIREQYSSLAFLINDPEIGALLRDAVDPAKAYSSTRFQAALQQTAWWKRTSTTQREWQVLANTNPGQAQQTREQFYDSLQNTAKRLGTNLSGAEIRWFSEQWLAQGLAPDSPTVVRGLLEFGRHKGNRGHGAVKTGMAQADAVFRNQFVKLGGTHRMQLGEALAEGTKTLQDIEAEAQSHAISRFPHLREQLMAGETMATLTDGHRQLIADELELDPNSVDMLDPRWSRAIHVVDPATGKGRLGTLHEAQNLARARPEWWQTARGKQADSGMVRMVHNIFGERKY